MEEKKFQHPEGKIQLMDGRVLDCYQSEQPDQAGTVNDDDKVVEQLFVDNAFVLWENRERILSDSRMFLCPLPIQSGLAYTGTMGFHDPTLGIYMEFWENCPSAHIVKKNGKRWLLWHIAGSPLSGGNCCCLVNPEGKTKCMQMVPFRDVWVPFVKINTRYNEVKGKYDAYSLRQVMSILEHEGNNY